MFLLRMPRGWGCLFMMLGNVFLLRVSWRKVFRSRLAKDGTTFAVCMALEYIRSLMMPICGTMACEVCSTNFFVSLLHQGLACWAECIDRYMELKHLENFLFFLTPKNLIFARDPSTHFVRSGCQGGWDCLLMVLGDSVFH